MNKYPKLNYEYDFDERVIEEAKDKGYIINMLVTLENGNRYRMEFYDPTRLSQDIETLLFECKHICYAEPNIIVVPEVTLECMQAAVNQLADQNFFEQLKPLPDNFCPACHMELDFKPWDKELASFEICPHCGLQFGYDDSLGGDVNKRPKLYGLWYMAWEMGGRKPISKEKSQEIVAKVMNKS